MILSPEPPSRELIWGGLGAACSTCGWTRLYQLGGTAHHLPPAELAKTIRSDYEIHRCEDFLGE